MVFKEIFSDNEFDNLNANKKAIVIKKFSLFSALKKSEIFKLANAKLFIISEEIFSCQYQI